MSFLADSPWVGWVIGFGWLTTLVLWPEIRKLLRLQDTSKRDLKLQEVESRLAALEAFRATFICGVLELAPDERVMALAEARARERAAGGAA